MKNKKVLFIITKSNLGGAQRYVYDLAKGLPNTYERVVALGGNDWLKQSLDKIGLRTIEVKAFQRDINLFKEFGSLVSLFRLIKEEKPDILHVNSSKAGGLGAFAGRVLRVPHVIFTAHGWAFNEQRSFGQKILITFFAWLTVVFAHTTIAVSGKLKRQIEKLPFVGRKIVVIHNGIETVPVVDKSAARNHLANFNNNLKDKVGLKYTWIGTVGELHPNKGVRFAVRAMSRVTKNSPTTIFVAIGEGEEKARLEELIDEFEMRDNVFLLGRVENAVKYLSALDIFTLSSHTEALGYVILEAGMAHLPVVVSDTGGIPEIINSHSVGVLVRPRKAKEIEHAIEHLLENPAEKEALGEALYKRTVEHFGLDRMLQDTMGVYNKK